MDTGMDIRQDQIGSINPVQSLQSCRLSINGNAVRLDLYRSSQHILGTVADIFNQLYRDPLVSLGRKGKKESVSYEKFNAGTFTEYCGRITVHCRSGQEELVT